jgi:hypothetical protein
VGDETRRGSHELLFLLPLICCLPACRLLLLQTVPCSAGPGGGAGQGSTNAQPQTLGWVVVPAPCLECAWLLLFLFFPSVALSVNIHTNSVRVFQKQKKYTIHTAQSTLRTHLILFFFLRNSFHFVQSFNKV